MKRLDVRIVGPVFDISGISSNVREFALALSETGIVVNLVNITNCSPFKATIDPTSQKRLDVMMNTPVSDNYVTIHFVPAEFMRLFDDKAKANICWTGYETDKLPYVCALMMADTRVSEVWVPTTTCLNVFNGAGIPKDKTKVVSWGVDTTLFQPGNPTNADLREDGSFYFSFIGSLKPSSGYDVVLKAFYEEFKDEPKLLRIRAVINVARDTQKGIIIGHQGKALKKVGTEARLDMEEFFEKKVFLEMYVKVAKDWRDKESQLRNFGYEIQ